MANQLTFQIVADADPTAVAGLAAKMDSLADAAHRANGEVKDLTRQLEEWRSANVGGVAPGQTTSIYGGPSAFAPAGPGATIAMGGGGLATSPQALSELKQYGDRAAYITEVANKMKADFKVVEEELQRSGVSVGHFTGRMRALRAVMYELSSTIPGLSQSLTALQYGGAGLAGFTLGVTALVAELKSLYDTWNNLQDVMNKTAIGGGGQFHIPGIGAGMGAMVLSVAKATQEWEQSTQRVMQHLQQIHTVQEAMLNVEGQRAERHLQIEQSVGAVTAAQSIMGAADIATTARQRALAERTRAENAMESALTKKLGPAAGRTVAQQTEIAGFAGTQAETYKSQEEAITAAIQKTEQEVGTEQEAFNKEWGEGSGLFGNVSARIRGVERFKKYGSYEEYAASQDYTPLNFITNTNARLYYATLGRIDVGRKQVQSLRNRLDQTRGLRGGAELGAATERQRLEDLKSLEIMRGEHGAAQTARGIEEEDAQRQDVFNVFSALRGTPEGAQAEQDYNRFREMFMLQQTSRRTMTPEETQAAQMLMQRATGRTLTGAGLAGAFSADPTSERYQRLINSITGAQVNQEQVLRQRAQYQQEHPYAAVVPQPFGEQRFGQLMDQARGANNATVQSVQVVGTYLQGVQTALDRLRTIVEDLGKQTKMRQMDSQIPHSN